MARTRLRRPSREPEITRSVQAAPGPPRAPGGGGGAGAAPNGPRHWAGWHCGAARRQVLGKSAAWHSTRWTHTDGGVLTSHDVQRFDFACRPTGLECRAPPGYTVEHCVQSWRSELGRGWGPLLPVRRSSDGIGGGGREALLAGALSTGAISPSSSPDRTEGEGRVAHAWQIAEVPPPERSNPCLL
eukprot:CAMPEP_0206007218 /NCGR_PEP_ID=MMETSP1464-20131121/5634_1 /ASSEMBLY_ACC=CAM_ASM_001124 /TAXON_ID=119497 /ORGANISM="Exanthemachrysis gayraliae, Strain RCC1523" /LENGTH=185 /DNA_ID=CAMNT_0053380709 /DNA_START=64 /DNA_END=619 /DNA_ORIENTATION=-